jgi:hypothetical protein
VNESSCKSMLLTVLLLEFPIGLYKHILVDALNIELIFTQQFTRLF